MPIPGCIDLGDKSASQVEQESSAVPPGWYRATVADVYLDKQDNLKMDFRLADGRKHVETLWNPNTAERPQRLQQRRGVFSIRLGLVPREAKGTAYEFDWEDAIGREVALELVESKPNDKGQRFVQISWMGLFAGDDPRVQEHFPASDRRQASQASAPQSAPAAKSSAAQTTKPDFNLDDL